VGVALVQGTLDHGMDSVRVAEHIIVPEAQHAIALNFNQSGSRGIARRTVLAAVNLDHEPRAMTREIGNEAADWDLSAKSGLRKGFSQQAPHRHFGIGGAAP